MPPVEFEPTNAAGERPQTYALDRAATGTGNSNIININQYARHEHANTPRSVCNSPQLTDTNPVPIQHQTEDVGKLRKPPSMRHFSVASVWQMMHETESHHTQFLLTSALNDDMKLTSDSLLKPSGYFMYHRVQFSKILRSLETVYLCGFVMSEQTANLSYTPLTE
jgi:hypothetical protein